MASASTVSSAPSKFAPTFRHNHVILSLPPKHDNVNLTLSATSSFLTNFTSSVCSSDTPANYSTSSAKVSFMFQEEKQSSVFNPVNHNSSTNLLNSNTTEMTESNCSKCSDENEFKADTAESMSIQEFDDNSSNSNCTQSSTDTNNTLRKKRRRGEEEILMEDLIGIDKTLADGITNNLKIQSQTSNDATSNSAVTTNGIADNNQTKSKVDSPAFHLRPRRSHKSYPGYCSSGSSSPIYYLSPIKRPKSKSPQKTNSKYNMQLFTDTTDKLNKHLSECSMNDTNVSNSQLSTELVDCKPTIDETHSMLRKVSDSVVQKVNVSVFSEMISPSSLSSNTVYPDNYISLKIVQIKPLRYVDLCDDNSDNDKIYPILELTTVDINDRFQLPFMQGIFDDVSQSQSSDKTLTVYLVGTYASKAETMLSEGSVISILSFRTTKFQIVKKQTESVKKRKGWAAKKGCSNEPPCYPFQIIVDCPNDRDANKLKQENGDGIEQLITDYNNNDLFVQQFIRTPRLSCALDSKWIPLVSISQKWYSPDDPKELNKSLYIPQTCKPKFESTSRTVKPITLAPPSSN